MKNYVKTIVFLLPKVLMLSGVLCFSLIQQGKSQQILWEKYWPNLYGQFDALVEGDSGFYFGCGVMTLVRNPNVPSSQRDTIISGILLVKLKPNGDTVWIKKISGKPNTLGLKATLMVRSGISLLQIVTTWENFPDPGLRVYTVSQRTGLNYLSTSIPDFYNSPRSISQDQEENLYIVGEQEKPLVANEYEMYCIKLSPDGTLRFLKGYSPGNHFASAAEYIEPMPGGKMRMSGNKGKTIVSYELDSNGVASNYKEYMDNPFGFVQQSGAYVQQSDSGYYLVSVKRFTGDSPTNLKSMVRKVDSNGNIIWSGIKNLSITQPISLLDGGYIITAGDLNNYFIQRFKKDSTLEWQENFLADPNLIKSFNGMLFDNNQGFSYGYIKRLFPGGDFPYIAKIANVGQPVDPANPVPAVGVQHKVNNIKTEVSYAFPNPTTGIFHVLGMGSGLFHLVNAQGKTVMEETHKGGDAIDVSGLPCGVYTYTLITKGSKTQGRVVRE